MIKSTLQRDCELRLLRLPQRYRAMTAASLDSAARTAIDPRRLLWVVVGDAKLVRPQLEGLGLPVEQQPGQ